MGLLDLTSTAALGLAGVSDQMRQRQLEEQERQRQIASQVEALARQRRADAAARTQAVQGAAGAKLQAGDGQGAAALMPEFYSSFNQAYGTNLAGPQVTGKTYAPKMAQMSGPMPQGAMRPPAFNVAPPPDFSGADTQAAVYGGLMLARPKPVTPEGFTLSEGQVRYDAKGNPLARGPEKTFAPRDPRQPELRQDPNTGEWFTPAPGMRTSVPARESKGPDYGRITTDWQQNKARFVQEAVRLRASTNKVTRPSPNGPVSVQMPPTDEQMAKWQKEAAAQYESLVPMPPPPGGVGRQDPFSNPSAPSGGVSRLKLGTTPTNWDDTALTPEWEGYATAATKAFPGSRISSRARSDARNREAGGADDSFHKHRMAFDLVNVPAKKRAAAIQWGRAQGLHVIDEGDHLHFQPLRTSEAPADDPQLSAFYQKHGIAPGGSNA